MFPKSSPLHRPKALHRLRSDFGLRSLPFHRHCTHIHTRNVLQIEACRALRTTSVHTQLHAFKRCCELVKQINATDDRRQTIASNGARRKTAAAKNTGIKHADRQTRLWRASSLSILHVPPLFYACSHITLLDDGKSRSISPPSSLRHAYPKKQSEMEEQHSILLDYVSYFQYSLTTCHPNVRSRKYDGIV